MTQRPLVTVCVPTIGRLRMLRETVTTLQSQTYTNYEVLVLDNASPPDSQEFLRRYAEADARARILRTEQRIPMFENFNRGIRAATGEYVVFFFDDDLYLPTFIERELAMLELHPSAGFVGSNYYLIDEAGRITGHRRLVKRTKIIAGRQYISNLVRSGRNVIGTPGIMYRRSPIEAHRFDEGLSIHFGDFVTLMRMAETCDVALIAEPLLQVRIHGAAASAISLSRSIPLRTRTMREYLAEYERRWPNDRVFVRFLKRQLGRSHRLGLLWGWFSAADERESEACLNELNKASSKPTITKILWWIDQVVLPLSRRRLFLVPLLRRLGNTVNM